MDMTFTKRGDYYVAEFEATAPFSMHIEMPTVGHFVVRQSAVQGGQYAIIDEVPAGAQYKKVVDYDFVGQVWPKYIQVEVASQPTMAVVTMAQ